MVGTWISGSSVGTLELDVRSDGVFTRHEPVTLEMPVWVDQVGRAVLDVMHDIGGVREGSLALSGTMLTVAAASPA